MRELKIELYSFGELDSRAKENAICEERIFDRDSNREEIIEFLTSSDYEYTKGGKRYHASRGE